MLRQIAVAGILLLALIDAQGQATQSARDYYRSAAAHFRAREYEAALADFNKTIELDPKNAHALFYRIMSLQAIDSKAQPINDWNKMIVFFPQYPQIQVIYSFRANYRAGLGQWDAGIDDLNKVIALTPSDGSAFHLRSLCYIGKGDMDRAYADYKRSVELKTTLQDPLITFGYAHKTNRRFEMALDSYSKALEWKPDDAIAYVNRGTVYILMGKIEAGLADIRKGMSIDAVSVAERAVEGFGCPFCTLNVYVEFHAEDARVYEARGILRLLQHSEWEAKTEFEKCISLEPALKDEVDRIIEEVRHWN